MVRDTRTEDDILGSVEVPKHAYYGIQTVRAYVNFQISDMGIHPALNDAILHIKIAAAKANMDAGALPKKIGNALVKASKDVLRGDYPDEFILDVYQAGAGTPWHMNVNEVITNVALEKIGKKKGQYEFIDPHNHTNMGQSTNDVIPTAMRISAMWMADDLSKELGKLVETLRKLSAKYDNVTKTGRTHLQDAVPITLGQEFNAWAIALAKRNERLRHARYHLRTLHIGGTAVGTGVNTSRGFSTNTIKHLKQSTKLPLTKTKDKIEGTQFMADFVDMSGAVRSLAVDLTKIANDIRLLQSGPRTGLGEITIPKVEPGSSIMPSKFNPSMAEMMNMVCYQVMGNDAAIQAGAAAGQLELNVMTPMIAHNLLQSLEIMTNGIREFNDRCVKGIKPNEEVLQEYFELNPLVGTLLNPYIGYNKVAKLVKEAIEKDMNVKDLAVKKGILSRVEADRLFGVKRVIKE